MMVPKAVKVGFLPQFFPGIRYSVPYKQQNASDVKLSITLTVGCSLSSWEKELTFFTFVTLSFLLFFFCRHTMQQASPRRKRDVQTATTAPPPVHIRTRSSELTPPPVAVETVGGGEGVMSNVFITAVSVTPPTSI